MTQVAIFIGSASDEPVISPCAEVLKKLGISFRFTVSSAHRTPERTEALVRELEEDGCQVFICAAGMAAHLAGAVAARTTRPVIGIPVAGSALGGMDAAAFHRTDASGLSRGHGGTGQGRSTQRGVAGGTDSCPA